MLPEGAESGQREPHFILSDFIWRVKTAGPYSDYLDFLKTQGYSGSDIEIMDPHGNFYLYSQILDESEWIQQPDFLNDYLKQRYALPTKKDEPPPLRASHPEVFLNISALARRLTGGDAVTLSSFRNQTAGTYNPSAKKLSPRELEKFVLSLQENYNFSDLSSELYPQELQTILFWSVNAIRRKLNALITSHPSTHYFFSSAFYDKELTKFPYRLAPLDAFPYPLNADENLNFPTVGLGDIAFPLAHSLNKEVWFGAAGGSGFPPHSEHNLFLYRTVQYAPAGYLLIPQLEDSYIYDAKKFNFEKKIKKDILEFYPLQGTKKKREKKPVANLVLSSEPDPDIYLPQFIEPISNALLANGYEIKVTFGSFFKPADLYYVVNSDEWHKNYLFFDELLNLLDYRKSHFYGTVILHPLTELLDYGRWKKIRELFKVPASEKGWVPDLPSTIELEGQNFLWKGTVPSQNYGMTFIRAEEVSNNYGEIVLADTFENQTFALILKSGTHFLVNGNFLHLAASCFLSHLMGEGGGALKAPTLAYVTADRNRTAALAIVETTLKIKIPSPEIPEKWRIIHFDSLGERILDTIEKGSEIFEIKLQPYELIILLY